jgi:hypothetical protein
MITENFYSELATKLNCNPHKARRCWEIWTMSAAFNYATEQFPTAVLHRRYAFQDESGLPDPEVHRLCNLLAEFEKEQWKSS